MATHEQHPDWMANLRDWYSIFSVLAVRPELPFFVIRWDGEEHLEWINLSDPRHQLEPFHFEIYFGKEHVRDAHYIQALRKASEGDGLYLQELFGFWDLFCPLPADGDRRSFLYAGQFMREHPRWETLCANWSALTGQQPASANPDFVNFVRMALRLPVLEPQLLEPMTRFIEQYALHLSGLDKGSIEQRVDEINREQLSKLWPIDHWVDSVISPDKFLLPPWYYEGKLADWVKEAIGIRRLPTTAMALMPLDDRASSMDYVQTQVRNARIQRECIAFARDLPQTAATRLQDYGVSIITSCKAGRGAPRARLELRERAQEFRAFVRERFQVHSVVGIGPTLSRGAPLYESHREAVLALHMCVQLHKDVLFFDEHGSSDKFRYSEVQKAANHLTEALDRDNATELNLASDTYVQLVLRYSNERIEVARSQFLAMLFQLLDVVQRRNPMRQDAYDSFVSDLTLRLEEARSLNEVIEDYNEALKRLSFVASKVWRGSNVMLLETTLQYLRDNFFEQLPLPKVARKAGFSVPPSTRVFKQATGTTFVSYLRSIRVDHARKLLTTTPLSLEQIAQSCGFNSQHHLIRSFKKVTGTTPGVYRRDHESLQQS